MQLKKGGRWSNWLALQYESNRQAERNHEEGMQEKRAHKMVGGTPVQDVYRAEKDMSRVLAIELPSAIQTEIRLHTMGVRRRPHPLATTRDRKERSTAHNTWDSGGYFVQLKPIFEYTNSPTTANQLHNFVRLQSSVHFKNLP